jgi:CO/xanthine dehydrogenase FAD-binding subunit
VKGGNRCYAIFSADVAPALMGQGAKIKVVSSEGEKLIALEEFYTGVGDTVVTLQPDELLTEVQVPNPLPHTGGVYLKHSVREAVDFGIVGIAATITLDPRDETCVSAKIVLGCISSAPIRALKAEGELQGKKIEDDLVGKAAAVATKEAGPIVPIEASVSYRRAMVEVFVKRAVKQASEIARSA